MNATIKHLVLIGVCVLLLSGCCAPRSSGTATTVWEYQVVTEYAITPPTHPRYAIHHAEQLNKHAAQGWEVLSSHTIATNESSGLREIVLRRPKAK